MLFFFNITLLVFCYRIFVGLHLTITGIYIDTDFRMPHTTRKTAAQYNERSGAKPAIPTLTLRRFHGLRTLALYVRATPSRLRGSQIRQSARSRRLT